MSAIRAAWTLRHGWERRYQRQKAQERLLLWVARRLPRKLRYWTFVTVGADATSSRDLADLPVPEMEFMDVLKVAGKQLGID